MDNSGGFIKKYSLFILSLIFVVLSVSFSVYSLMTYRLNSSGDNTVIGNIFIGSNNGDDYSSSITYGINEWESNALYTLTYQNQSYSNILYWFDFDLNATLDSMTIGSKNNAVFGISQNSKDAMLAELSERFPQELMDAFDFEAFFADVIDDLKQMYYLKNYQLIDYLSVEASESIIDTFTINNISPTDATSITDALTEISIPASSRFSLLDALNDTSLTNEQLSIVASGIEHVILNTYFTGITKSQYSVSPAWADEASNVRILRLNHLDFQFFNDLPLDYFVTLELNSASSIAFTLKGYPNSETIIVEISDEMVLPFETIIIEDDTLDGTTLNVLVEETVDSWIYTVVDQIGVDGYLKTYTKSITDALNVTETIFLMNEFTSPTTEMIRQNIVLKGD